MSDLFDNGAEFSDCKKYRYALWRIWDESKPFVMFIGLNPSIANENSDDPTIRRVRRFSADWGYGGVYMVNLFAWVTAYPQELNKCDNPLADNDKWLEKISNKCDKIIFAWGSFAKAQDRGRQMIKMFPNAHALMINSNGSPRHPLYVKSDVVPIPIKPL
ncbi:MAG: DUF1643 domain-containing protein [Bacteroidetes bacterium]|nr:DUF1643 domain-containing protein [Bacteroidota bacterium]